MTARSSSAAVRPQPLSRQSNSPKRTRERTLAAAGTKESKKIARTGSPFAWRLLGIVPGPFPGPLAVRSDRFHQRLSRFHMEKWANPVSSLRWQVIESGRCQAEGFPTSIPTALEGHDPIPGNRPGEKHMHFIRQLGGTPRTIEPEGAPRERSNRREHPANDRTNLPCLCLVGSPALSRRSGHDSRDQVH